MTLYSALLAIVSLSNLFIAIFVLTRNVKSEINRIFCYFGLSLAVWGFGGFARSIAPDASFAMASVRFTHLGLVFIPSTFYHFALTITGDKGRFNRRLSWVAYILSLIFIGLDRFGLMARDVTYVYGFYYPVAGVADKYFNIFFLLLCSYSLYLLYRRYRRTGSTLEKNRLKYLFMGITIALLSSITNILLLFGIRVYPLAPVGLFGYNLCVAYAIVRYHLMDINILIRWGIAYSVLSGAFSGLFFFFLVMFERVLFMFAPYQRTLFSGITTALVISTVFQPLRERVQTLIDRAFFREGYNTRLALLDLSQRITELIDRQEVLSITLRRLMEIFHLDRAIILLRKDDNSGYGVRLSMGLSHLERRTIFLPQEAILVRFLRKSGYGVLRAEVEENPRIDPRLIYDFNNLGVELCIPIIYGGELLGILALGKRPFKRLYSPEEIGILTNLGEKVALGIENTRLNEEMKECFLRTILMLVRAIGAKDAYTWRHCENVSMYALKVAEELGLSEELIEAIRIGGLLHDIGKIGIDDKILLKPERLTKDEFNVIKNHPLIGAIILESIELHPETRDGVHHHHERPDGKGYPDGINKEGLSLCAKILAIVDAYDAMTTNRPYRKAMRKEEAIEELKRGCGRHFDEDIVEVFLRILLNKEDHHYNES